jgi:hypothetical protein
LPTTINTPQVTGTQQLVVADFDGDGKLDVASGAGNFLLLGNGDGTFQPVLGLGASGAGITVGDFNLDGKPDLAVGGVTILMNVSPAPVRSATATSLTSSLNPSAYDQAVSFKAVVSTPAGGNASGNVIFSDGGSTLGTATLVNGSTTFSVTSFAVGSHSVTASYGGNASFIPSTSALTQIVNTAPTTTVATESPSPAVFGQSIMITAQVTSSAGTPAGVITFLDGTTTIGTGSLNGNGQAAFNTSALGAGAHTVAASYGANGNFSGSTSAAVALTVNKSSTVTSIAEQTPNPSVAAQPVTVSFAVKASPPGSGTPTGSVMVNDGTGDSCTATVASAACTITFASAGPKTLAVSYDGDSNFSSSASIGITHNVKDFSISASPISQSVKAVQKVSYKVTLAPLNGFTGTMSLSCVGLPAGSICSFAPSSTSLTTTSSSATTTITVQTSKTTPKGTYNLNLVGIYASGSPASGGLTHGAKVTLIVQ